MTLTNIVRCPATANGGTCNSAVFYDWGIQIIEKFSASTPIGQAEKFKDYASASNVHICARCTTPYIKVEGELIDISEELSAEDVKLILSRGQAQLPHPKLKDP